MGFSSGLDSGEISIVRVAAVLYLYLFPIAMLCLGISSLLFSSLLFSLSLLVSCPVVLCHVMSLSSVKKTLKIRN